MTFFICTILWKPDQWENTFYVFLCNCWSCSAWLFRASLCHLCATLWIIPQWNREGDFYSLVSEVGLSSSNFNTVIEPEEFLLWCFNLLWCLVVQFRCLAQTFFNFVKANRFFYKVLWDNFSCELKKNTDKRIISWNYCN